MASYTFQHYPRFFSTTPVLDIFQMKSRIRMVFALADDTRWLDPIFNECDADPTLTTPRKYLRQFVMRVQRSDRPYTSLSGSYLTVFYSIVPDVDLAYIYLYIIELCQNTCPDLYRDIINSAVSQVVEVRSGNSIYVDHILDQLDSIITVK